jgi:glycosyltransferase involved in cell wall biosynthesis
MTFLSVISPCYNEEDNVELCILRTHESLTKAFPGINFEHIFIDNASTDNTIEKLQAIKLIHPHVRILKNSQNVGVFSSIQKGIKFAQGDWIVPFLASDCQDPPEMISEMISTQQINGCDSVFALRATRSEHKIMFGLRKVFYWSLKRLTKSKFKPGASEFCLIRQSPALRIADIDDPNPFLRIYLNQLAGDAIYIPFHMDARTKGKSSANIFSLVDDALSAFSLLLPSIFSRVLIFSTILFFVGIATTIYSIIDFFLLPFSLEKMFTPGLVITGISALFAFNAVIGHYIYIIHNSIRRKVIVETSEVNNVI